jgi:hypothetical protein
MSAEHQRPGTDDELSVQAGHELSDAQAAPALKFLVGLFLTTIVIAALMVFFYNYLEHREAVEKAPRYPMAAGQVRPLPPPPRLQSYPFQDIKSLRQEEERFLRGYGWVDESAGTVRIPIEHAMDMLAAQGLPHRAQPPAGGAAGAAAGGAGPLTTTGASSGRDPVAVPSPAGEGTPRGQEQPAQPGGQPDGGRRPAPGQQGQPH